MYVFSLTGINHILFITIIVIAISSYTNQELQFTSKYEWSKIDFEFNSEQERLDAINNKTFDYGNLQPIDAQYYYDEKKKKERIFITLPRFPETGIPATIGTVTDKKIDGNNLLKPYPSWSWHLNLNKCNPDRIVSVFRVWIDDCNRIWILDAGVISDRFICSPQILAFDLDNDKLVERFEIPSNLYENSSHLVTPVVELFKKYCKIGWVYIADTAGSLLVYSIHERTAWNFKHSSLSANPNYAVYNVAGNSFEFADGVLGLALSPPTLHPRKLFYHPLASIEESWVYTRDIQYPNNRTDIFHTFPAKRNDQSVAEAFDSKGNLYFPLVSAIKIISWNYKTDYYSTSLWTVVNSDQERMQFPSGLKVTRNSKGQERLWVFATALQRWASGNLNPNVTNFRLRYADLH